MKAFAEKKYNALKTDLYELTMAAGYFQNQVNLKATFELSCHTMPTNRSFLVTSGLEHVVDYILNLRFTNEEIKFLKTLPALRKVSQKFFDYLKRFKFSGDVWAMPEGEIFFAREPIIQIEAPIIEAQILETYLLSVMNISCLVTTKAARIVQAARTDGKERAVIDFGSRRAHGPEAGVLAARAAYVGGCLGTSNILAAKRYGIPVFGTVAHSWVEAFESEEESFRRYYQIFPENTILLIDTYDTLQAVEKILKLNFRKKIRGVRIDSGDLAMLSKRVRKMLDRGGLKNIKIIASGNLNEYKILDLIKVKASIDSFGVGTEMVTSRDYPALDLTYKLVQIHHPQKGIQFKTKRSLGKSILPGHKQVFRKISQDGKIEGDIIGLFTEPVPENTRPLLKKIIEDGNLRQPLPTIDQSRKYVRERLSQLPVTFLNCRKTCSFKKGLSQKMLQLKNYMCEEDEI